MSLTQCAWAVTTQILLLILPDMAVVPGNADGPFGFGVIYFRRTASFHGAVPSGFVITYSD